jgi:DNA-binding Xre family transcriptional regulator
MSSTTIESVKLGIFGKLKNRVYRRAFFRSKARDDIVLEIQRMIKVRGMSVTALAEASGMKQSAMSRLLSSDYGSWTFNTLIRVSEGLDACWEFRLRPAEEVMYDYDQRNDIRAGDSAMSTEFDSYQTIATVPSKQLVVSANV